MTAHGSSSGTGLQGVWALDRLGGTGNKFLYDIALNHWRLEVAVPATEGLDWGFGDSRIEFGPANGESEML
jgi:hypothetical protein